MADTVVMVDGLHDPEVGRQLSAAWHEAGLGNRVDPAGQAAWLWRAGGVSDDDKDPVHRALDEAALDRAAQIAIRFGVAWRDRVGQSFLPDVTLAALRQRVAWEYKSRFATALVFGLPALALHYLSPMLAGAAIGPQSMALPWLFELLLAGWVCVAAGWPLLVQGGAGLAHGRPNGDAVTLAVIALSMAGSIAGVAQLVLGGEPWFTREGGSGPLFDAAVWAVLAATAQRWVLHAYGDCLAGRGRSMVRGHRYLMLGLLVALAAMFTIDPRGALAMALAAPTTLSLMAVNPWSAGWLFVVPVGIYAALVSGWVVALDGSSAAVRVEAAALFSMVLTGLGVIGWRHMPTNVKPA